MNTPILTQSNFPVLKASRDGAVIIAEGVSHLTNIEDGAEYGATNTTRGLLQGFIGVSVGEASGTVKVLEKRPAKGDYKDERPTWYRLILNPKYPA